MTPPPLAPRPLRHTLLRAPIIAALAVAAFYGTALWHGWSPAFDCIEEQYPNYANYPWDVFIGQTLIDGRFPLWNPHNAFGVPLLAHLLPAAAFLPKLPLYFSDAQWVRDGYVLVCIWLAVWGMTVFLERRRFSFAAALVGAFAFGFSGYLMRFANETYLNIEALLPWWLLAAERIAERASMRRVLVAAACVALILTGGNPEAAFYTLAAMAGMVVVHARPGRRSAALCGLAGAFAVGGMLAAPQLLPFVASLAQDISFHEGWLGVLHYKAHDLASVVIPSAWGGFADYLAHKGMPSAEALAALGPHSTYAGSVLGWRPPYIGLVPTLLAACGVLMLRRDRRVVAWTAIAIVIVGALWGLPIFRSLAHLPLVRITGAYKHLFPLLTVALAVCATSGAEQLMQRVRRHQRASRVALGIVLSLYPLAVLEGQRRHAWGLWTDAVRRPSPDFPHRVTPNYPDTQGWLAPIGGTTPPNLNLLAGTDDIRSMDGLYDATYVGMVGALADMSRAEAIDAFNQSGGFFPFGLRALSSPVPSLLGITAAASDSPLSDPRDLWVYRALLARSDIEAPSANFVRPIIVSLKGFRQAAVYQHPPSRIRTRDIASLPRHLPWMQATVDPAQNASVDGSAYVIICEPSDGPARVLLMRHVAPTENPWIRYTATPRSAESPPCPGGAVSFITLPGPTTTHDWAGWTGFPPPTSGLIRWTADGRFLYHRADALPRVFLDPAPLTVSDWAAGNLTVDALVAERRLVLATTDIGPPAHPPKHTPRRGMARIIERHADALLVHVVAPTPAWVGILASYAPGWEAWVWGTSGNAPYTIVAHQAPHTQRIIRAYGMMQAVQAPAGASLILLRYAPADFRIGLWVMLTTVLCGVGMAHRRRTPRTLKRDVSLRSP